ncbi:MAG TPA: 2TM domain-containing protein, partial [Candidatus Binataceae bacterium]|nr:2TM domain-containing protein [Candidatus Binataceae bacterium]
MFGLIIIAVIIFAVYKHNEAKRRRQSWNRKYWGATAQNYVDKAERYAAGFQRDLASTIRHHAIRSHNSDFERRMAEKFERKAERIERRLRRRFDRETQRYSGTTVDPAKDGPPKPEPQFKSDAERQAYDRARKRATAQMGFYVHLMWYGLVIGFLFLLNLMTSPFGYQWWIWPAFGWGIGVASHFTAVFGWRWVHERVFEPAIQR